MSPSSKLELAVYIGIGSELKKKCELGKRWEGMEGLGKEDKCLHMGDGYYKMIFLKGQNLTMCEVSH